MCFTGQEDAVGTGYLPHVSGVTDREHLGPPLGELSLSYLQMFQRVQTSESLLGNRSNAVSLEHSGVGEEVQSNCSKF